ncbi:phosphoinositide-interacting protein-like [Erpetoichthys calabaricus]|uniref:Phosphoinositide interacting regulator of transient receptor potential channels n=1 Tax=Erpetoichthys calabaricus TaxID=27687 RepID=A0A8C4TQI1_ERPCA|nr:phosphoinositide-interacting protein-like [Erpetoichthys calabaricus]
MEINLESIGLGEQSRSQSKDLLTFQTESTVFSLSRSESLWTTESRSAWETYHKPIVVMSIGGAIFLCGVILTGLHFAKKYERATMIFGPGFLSLGLIVLVTGLVWVPIMKEKRKQKSVSRLFSSYKPPFFHF